MTSYMTILADPPWQYKQPLKMRDGVKRASKDQYPTMTVDQIMLLGQSHNGPEDAMRAGQRRGAPYRTIANHRIHDVALLGLWITAPMLLAGIHNLVCQHWGFEPKQIIPWIKGRMEIRYHEKVIAARHLMSLREVMMLSQPCLVMQPGMGALTRGVAEYLILATRGNYTRYVKSHSENGLLLGYDDAVIVAPKRRHSQKPDAQYGLLERLFQGPRLELFARGRRPGWKSWGNQVSKRRAA